MTCDKCSKPATQRIRVPQGDLYRCDDCSPYSVLRWDDRASELGLVSEPGHAPTFRPSRNVANGE